MPSKIPKAYKTIDQHIKRRRMKDLLNSGIVKDQKVFQKANEVFHYIHLNCLDYLLITKKNPEKAHIVASTFSSLFHGRSEAIFGTCKSVIIHFHGIHNYFRKILHSN
jgi:hypothetical protein